MHESSSRAASILLSVPEQIRLIDQAVTSGNHFKDVLADNGWGYDDLRYATSRSAPNARGRPTALTDFSRSATPVPFVSFFTGCGGMDLGLEAVGWKHVAGFEIQELFCKTLRKNRSWKIFGPPVHSGDVSKLDEISDALANTIIGPFEGVFVGGPPCQPFSIASNQRFSKAGANFKRTGFAHEKNGNLLFDFVYLVRKFRPTAFIIENVPGLRDLDGGAQLQEAISFLEADGYTVAEPTVYDAANYGVPQQRQRLIVVGSRTGKSFVPPKHSNPQVGCGAALQGVDGLPNHETRDHAGESIRRYMGMGYGEREQLGRVDRLDPLLPSKTVIAGGTNGGGRSHLHPEIPRTLSVRECARLQTFPDDFVFVGPTARQFTQVGNAVPPVLAAHIGQAVAKSFF